MLENLGAKIASSAIEKFTIDLLEKQGFHYISEIALGSGALLPKQTSGEVRVAFPSSVTGSNQ